VHPKQQEERERISPAGKSHRRTLIRCARLQAGPCKNRRMKTIVRETQR
jgi:hypothetical protein